MQRDRRVEGETLEQQIGRVLGAVGPSLMMTGVSEGVSFFLGKLKLSTPSLFLFPSCRFIF